MLIFAPYDVNLIRPIPGSNLSKACSGQRGRAIAVSAVLVAALIACAGITPQRIALNSLQGIRDSVTTSLKVFNAGYQAGQPGFGELQRTQLQTLYGKYLAADKIAAESLAATTTDPPAIVAQVTIVAGDVLRFVQSLQAAPTPAPSPHP